MNHDLYVHLRKWKKSLKSNRTIIYFDEIVVIEIPELNNIGIRNRNSWFNTFVWIGSISVSWYGRQWLWSDGVFWEGTIPNQFKCLKRN
jgi:hypothetical protein